MVLASKLDIDVEHIHESMQMEREQREQCHLHNIQLQHSGVSKINQHQVNN